MLERVVSGGQTGVDRAALDAALAIGLPCGGWCPHGRLAEDGVIDARYPLRQTPSGDYPQRTEWNVRDSDGTLVLVRGAPSGGTAYTIRFAERLRRPLLVLDLDAVPSPLALRGFVATERLRVLNVAGPRESGAPGIYAAARAFLEPALTAAAGRGR